MKQEASSNGKDFEALYWLRLLPVFRVHLSLENCEKNSASAELLSVVGSQVRHQIWRNQCAAVRDGLACADRVSGDPLCECAPNNCLAHQLLPLSAETKKPGGAWLSPGILVHPIARPDRAPVLRVTIIGDLTASRHGRQGAEAALFDLIDVLTRLRFAPKLVDQEITTFGRHAERFLADRWRLTLETPWVLEKNSVPSVSLVARANGFRQSMAERVYKLTALALWSARRAGKAAPDGAEAHNVALEAKRRSLDALLGVNLTDTDLWTEIITPDAAKKPTSEKPLRWHVLSGWFELSTEPANHCDFGVLVALATTELIGIGEATSKGYGAVSIAPTRDICRGADRATQE